MRSWIRLAVSAARSPPSRGYGSAGSFPEFARVLLDAARRWDADVVAAPWVHLEPGADPREAYARARAAPTARIGLTTNPGVFPDRELETPFLPGNVLINRRVFDRV